MGSDTLRCSGVVQRGRTNGSRVIHFRAPHCRGCNGRCGVGFRISPMPLAEAVNLFRASKTHAPVASCHTRLVAPAAHANLSPGTGVVVTASARELRRGAFWAFGPPLVAVAGSTILAHFSAWDDWTLAAVAGLAIALTPVLARWKYAA